MIINLAPGCEKAEVIIREVDKVNELPVLAPVKLKILGTISVPFEFLQKRLPWEDHDQIDLKRTHIIVEREKISISLIINENDEYTRGAIGGILDMHPKFREFGINTGKAWTPTDLGLFFKMNRAFFPDMGENNRLVSQLMNFTATISSNFQRGAKETGDRTDNFSQVVNSNLPEKFTLQIPLFKGMTAERIEVETFVQIDGHNVSFVLLSPGAQATLEEIRDHAIDEQLDKIRELCPAIPILEL